jgi:hypothetical protein
MYHTSVHGLELGGWALRAMAQAQRGPQPVWSVTRPALWTYGPIPRVRGVGPSAVRRTAFRTTLEIWVVP